MPHYFDYIGSAGDLSLVLLDRFEYYEYQAIQRKYYKLATLLFAGTLWCFVKWRDALWETQLATQREEELREDACRRSQSDVSSSSWIRVGEAADSDSDETQCSFDGSALSLNPTYGVVSLRQSGPGYIV